MFLGLIGQTPGTRISSRGRCGLEPRIIRLIDALHTILRSDQILQGAAAERAYDCDAYTVDRSKPAVVVLPESTEDVANFVRKGGDLSVILKYVKPQVFIGRNACW